MKLSTSLACLCTIVASACQADFDPALLDVAAAQGGGAGTAAAGCPVDELCAGDSCCAAANVPAGSFDRSFDATGSAEQPNGDPVAGYQARGAAPATISSFRLDVFEVTGERLRRFVEGYDAWRSADNPRLGAGAHPLIDGSGWQASWSEELPPDRASLVAALACGPEATYASGAATLPANCLSWYVAFAFCAWDGARLPTEAEWNYAAAGADEQRAFPWSEPAGALTLDSEHAVYGDVAVARVGSVADKDGGRFGHHDLAGNVREWTLDAGGEISSYTAPNGCHDCAALSGSRRTRRGGDFGADAARSRTAYRSSALPDVVEVYNGVRCAR